MAAYSGRGIHGQTVRELARRIVSGQVVEGETLDVAAIGAELDVSRTVLREALKVLTAKGLVDARPKRGTFVRRRADWNVLDGDLIRWEIADGHNDEFLDHLQEVREILGPAGARLAAKRRTEPDLQALQDGLARMRTAGADPHRQVAADLAFHRALLAATHNELLSAIEIAIEPGLARRDGLVHPVQPDDALPAHEEVIEAIARQRPAHAEAAMKSLLKKAREDLARVRERQRPNAG